MGNDSKTANGWVCMGKSQSFYPWKKGKLVKKDKKKVYFRSRSRVSKRAAQEAYRAAIFSREVENLVPNLKDKKTYAVHIRNLK